MEKQWDSALFSYKNARFFLPKCRTNFQDLDGAIGVDWGILNKNAIFTLEIQFPPIEFAFFLEISVGSQLLVSIDTSSRRYSRD